MSGVDVLVRVAVGELDVGGHVLELVLEAEVDRCVLGGLAGGATGAGLVDDFDTDVRAGPDVGWPLERPALDVTVVLLTVVCAAVGCAAVDFSGGGEGLVFAGGRTEDVATRAALDVGATAALVPSTEIVGDMRGDAGDVRDDGDSGSVSDPMSWSARLADPPDIESAARDTDVVAPSVGGSVLPPKVEPSSEARAWPDAGTAAACTKTRGTAAETDVGDEMVVTAAPAPTAARRSAPVLTKTRTPSAFTIPPLRVQHTAHNLRV